MEEKKEVVYKEENAVSIVGFVFSILSIFLCGIPSLIGLILSIVGLNKSKKVNGKGKGLSIAGIIISAIMMVVFIVLSIVIAIGAINISGIIKDSNNNYSDIIDIDGDDDYYIDDSNLFNEQEVKLVYDEEDWIGTISIYGKKIDVEATEILEVDTYKDIAIIKYATPDWNEIVIVNKEAQIIFEPGNYDTEGNYKSNLTGNLYTYYERYGNEIKIYSWNLSPQVPGEEACDMPNKDTYVEFYDVYRYKDKELVKKESGNFRTANEAINYYGYKCN